MKTIIYARNLSKNYGKFTAVDRISFDIKEGECFGFLEPNGAGKTTTVRMIHCVSPLSAIMGILPVSIASILVLLVLMLFVGILFSSLAMIVTSFAPNFDFFNYYVAICRGVFSGKYSRQLIFHFLVIFILEVTAFYLGIKLMKKRLIK